MLKALALLAGTALGVALAIWLIPASVHIVGWPATGPVRVALLQPLSKLWWSVAVVAIVMGGVAAAVAARDRARLIDLSRALAPLMMLWLWPLPYMPWLPDRAPLLLVLAGPIRWAIAAGAMMATLWSVAAVAGGRGWRAMVPRLSTSLPGRGAVFGVSLGLYLFCGFSSAIAIGPGADEPHYLVIAHSLLVDHDLDIENNHAQRDYRDFFGGELRPDYLQRGRHGEIYSIHAPGLPALLLPAYAIAGYRGAVAFICLLAALAALAVFELSEAIAGRGPALVAWAATCLTVPWVPHAWLIFPEMPGALVVAWAVLWLWKPLPDALAIWFGRGIALALLPWLHTKFVVLLAMLTGFLLLRLWPRLKASATLVAPIGVSAVLWLCSFYWMYGVFDPEAPYGSYTRTFIRLENIPRGLLGLLFDQKFGLLAYAPVYVLAAAGFWIMMRRPGLRALAIGLASLGVVFVVSSTRLYMWWGGSSAPARYLVPVLPLLAPMIAVAGRDLRGAAGRATLGLLLSVSLAIAVVGVAVPDRLFLFSEPHGYARLTETIQSAAPLSALLPTFTDENWRMPLRMLLPWLGAALVGALSIFYVGRRAAARWHGPFSTLWTAMIGSVVFMLTSSLIAGTPVTAARLATANRGQIELMVAYDGPRLRGFDYTRMTKVNDEAILALATLAVHRQAGEPSDPRRLVGPFELPAGHYRSRIWFEGGRPLEGDAVVMLGNHGDLALTRVGLDSGNVDGADMPFELAVDTGLWVGLTNVDAAKMVRRLDVIPAQLVPRTERPVVDARVIEPIEGWPGGLIVYADENTYPEGGIYWTRGTRTGQVFVAPSTASAILLTLSLGPNGGRVRVSAGGHDWSTDLKPDEARQIAIPVTSRAHLVPVVVTAPGMFRPADVDRRSTDLRWLGCQVRIELK
jgi:hypothetical protein